MRTKPRAFQWASVSEALACPFLSRALCPPPCVPPLSLSFFFPLLLFSLFPSPPSFPLLTRAPERALPSSPEGQPPYLHGGAWAQARPLMKLVHTPFLGPSSLSHPKFSTVNCRWRSGLSLSLSSSALSATACSTYQSPSRVIQLVSSNAARSILPSSCLQRAGRISDFECTLSTSRCSGSGLSLLFRLPTTCHPGSLDPCFPARLLTALCENLHLSPNLHLPVLVNSQHVRSLPCFGARGWGGGLGEGLGEGTSKPLWVYPWVFPTGPGSALALAA